jgi:hypothetical protein
MYTDISEANKYIQNETCLVIQVTCIEGPNSVGASLGLPEGGADPLYERFCGIFGHFWTFLSRDWLALSKGPNSVSLPSPEENIQFPKRRVF